MYRHPIPAAVGLTSDDYVACWTNEHLEEVVFIAQRGRAAGILLHQDLDWDPVDVVGGLVPDIVLSNEELAFVSLCMSSTKVLRNLPVEKDEPVEFAAVHDKMANEPFTKVSVSAVLGFGTCGKCGAAIVRDAHAGWGHRKADGSWGPQGCRTASKYAIGADGEDRNIPTTWRVTPTDVRP